MPTPEAEPSTPDPASAPHGARPPAAPVEPLVAGATAASGPAVRAAPPARRGFRLSALEAEEAERLNRRIAHGWGCLCCNV
jgi:hypothetical protein